VSFTRAVRVPFDSSGDGRRHATGFFVAGLTLLGIGLERLINSYLLSGHLQGGTVLARFLLGEAFAAVGGLFLAFAGYLYVRGR